MSAPSVTLPAAQNLFMSTATPSVDYVSVTKSIPLDLTIPMQDVLNVSPLEVTLGILIV